MQKKSSLKKLGEFGLIKELTKNFKVYQKNIKVGIGDDAAVRQIGLNKFEVITLDTLVENDHFNLAWSKPEQIGRKAIEVNVSDVAAMGAKPTYALASLVISKNINLAWLKKLYAAMQKLCAEYKISLIGGDTTHGEIAMISIAMAGEASRKNLCLRSGAKIDDLICVSGETGGSMAGYLSFKNGLKLTAYLKKRHLEPKARLGLSQKIAAYASAMIDVSDGVASEVKHIASVSEKGALVYAEKLPIHQDVFRLEEKLKLKKYYCALSGGEDFELLFTISAKNLAKLKTKLSSREKISIIGKITNKPNEFNLILPSGQAQKLPDGWDHLLC